MCMDTSIVNPYEDKMICVVAPSWAGKTGLIKWLFDDELYSAILEKSISTVSRAPRENNGVLERDAVDYHFRTLQQIQHLIDTHQVLESNQNFPGKLYATTRESVESIRRAWRLPIKDIDFEWSYQIQKTLPQSLHLFVTAGTDLAVYEKRIRERNKARPEDWIVERMDRLPEELAQQKNYEHVIENTNGNFDAALHHLKQIIFTYVQDMSNVIK